MSKAFDRQLLRQNFETAERYHENLLSDLATEKYLEARGITADLRRTYLLGVCDDVRPGWLSIPYIRPSGVIWFNYRNPEPGAKPKYQSNGARHLYNTEAFDIADRYGEIAICEGEFDAIIATKLGIPAVGVPGATNWVNNHHWHELFRGYPKVLVLADPDDAGESLAQTILDTLPAARVVRLPADVTDTYLQHGGLGEWLS